MLTKVLSKEVKPCLACPICTNPFKDATTISECLHTFCRSCIRNKFINERVNACPVCNVNLGVFPLEKLRSDCTWQDLKLKIYRAMMESLKKAGPKTVAASVKSSKKKRKSRTSLRVSSSRVSSSPDTPLEPANVVVEPPNVVVEEKHRETVLALQSTRKPIITFQKRGRKASLPKKIDSKPEPELPPKEPKIKNLFDLNNEPEDNGLDEAEGSTFQEVVPKEKDLCKPIFSLSVTLNINDTPPDIVEPEISSDDDTEESVEPIQNKCVVNRETKEVPVQVNQNSLLISSDRDREDNSGQKLKTNGAATSRSRKKKGKKPVEKSYSLRPRIGRRTVNPAAGTTTPEAPVSVEEEMKVEEGRNNNPVWFSLKPSKTQNIEMLLPPITACCIRVKDSNMTVSYLKKYLMVKLGLESEDQVEIWLRDEPVCSSLTLHNLVDWWVQTTPLPERQSAMVGSSAAEFIMDLYYSFKSDASDSGSAS
ncbi:unnamed protein product [Arabidopsis thaliana]|nr:unnamed protein product [Arabidopsis thaliana]